jgi:hypothetical protein
MGMTAAAPMVAVARKSLVSTFSHYLATMPSDSENGTIPCMTAFCTLNATIEKLYALNAGVIGQGIERHERPHKPVLLLAVFDLIAADLPEIQVRSPPGGPRNHSYKFRRPNEFGERAASTDA